MAVVLGVVESDLAFIARLRAHFEDLGTWDFRVARSGEEAILYLRGVGVYAARDEYPVPVLVLLDAQNASGGDLQVLGWLRSESEFTDLPVVIMSTPRAGVLVEPLPLDPKTVIVPRTTFEGLDRFLLSMLVSVADGERRSVRWRRFTPLTIPTARACPPAFLWRPAWGRR